MADAFLGEVRLYGFNFPPRNWAACIGQLLPISQNTQLFSLLGTNYGGNGTTNFQLPNFTNNVVVGAGTAATGTTYEVGEVGGSATVTLTQNELPLHTHAFSGGTFRNDATTGTPANNTTYGNATGCKPYLPANTSPTPPMVAMSPLALGPSGPAGGAIGHNNLMPTMTVNYCICMSGIFPPRP